MSTDRSTGSGSERVRAIRGATIVRADESGAIIAAAAELLREMLDRNEVQHDDLISVVFTSTSDLSAEFPATAARRIGISDIPLLCASEIPVEGSMPSCVRILLHCYTSRSRSQIDHVYLGEARHLRDDLPGGQPSS